MHWNLLGLASRERRNRAFQISSKFLLAVAAIRILSKDNRAATAPVFLDLSPTGVAAAQLIRMAVPCATPISHAQPIQTNQLR